MSGPALVIPIKPTLGAKQRLAGRLDADARRLLALAMAGDMMRLAVAVAGAARCVVVGADEAVAQLAARSRIATVPERGAGQSAAVRTGVEWARDRGFTAIATVAADCPLAVAEDIEELLAAAARRGRFLACVPDAEGTGTNAAALRPLDVDPWRFGPNSLRRHRLAAAAAELRFSILELASLGLDVDRPDDLVNVTSHPRPTATFHLLRQLGIARRAAV